MYKMFFGESHTHNTLWELIVEYFSLIATSHLISTQLRVSYSPHTSSTLINNNLIIREIFMFRIILGQWTTVDTNRWINSIQFDLIQVVSIYLLVIVIDMALCPDNDIHSFYLLTYLLLIAIDYNWSRWLALVNLKSLRLKNAFRFWFKWNTSRK